MGLAAAERQARYRERQYAKIAALSKVPCGCGCGTLIAPLGRRLRPVRFAHGHNATTGGFRSGHPTWNRGKPHPRASEVHRGKKLSAKEIARRKTTRLMRNGGVYQTKRGWKHSPETIARFVIASRSNRRCGSANPMFGKRGPLASGWRGGTGQLPYGHGFTRARKREILERDGHRCRRCDKHQSELKRTVQVHHLDHDKQNNDPSNLVAACCACNIWASWNRDQPFIRIPQPTA